FAEPALFGSLVAQTAEGPCAVLVQLPPPTVQITRVHLQGAGHFGHALSTVQAADCRLFELFGEFPSRLHFPIFPFQCFSRVNWLSQERGPVQMAAEIQRWLLIHAT